MAHVDVPDAWYVKRSSPDEVVAAVTDRKIEGVRRIGKLLVLDLDDGTRLGLRFGMSGRLLVDGGAAIDRLQYASGRNNPAWDRFGLRFTMIAGRAADPEATTGMSDPAFETSQSHMKRASQLRSRARPNRLSGTSAV